jgi:hypothetical protein
MTRKQKMRDAFAKHVQKRVSEIACMNTGRKQFAFYDTTGVTNGTPTCFWTDKIRVWKFVPKHCLYDKGWENDHLDKYGCYKNSDIVDISHYGQWARETQEMC